MPKNETKELLKDVVIVLKNLSGSDPDKDKIDETIKDESIIKKLESDSTALDILNDIAKLKNIKDESKLSDKLSDVIINNMSNLKKENTLVVLDTIFAPYLNKKDREEFFKVFKVILSSGSVLGNFLQGFNKIIKLAKEE